MYYSDGRWRRQSLVYFGEPQDSSANVGAGRFGGGYRRSADAPRIQGLPCTITTPETSHRRTRASWTFRQGNC